MLQKQTSYTKDGVVTQLKIPNMKVMGKLMDKDEKLRVVFLNKDGVSYKPAGHTYPSGKKSIYDSWSIFVKNEGDESPDGGYYMNLSSQAGRDLMRLDPKQFDVLELTKDFRENKKTGAMNPIVVWKKVEKEEGSNASPSVSPKIVIDKPPMGNVEMSDFERELAVSLKAAGCDIGLCMHNFNKYKNSGSDVGEVDADRIKKIIDSV